MNHIIFQIQDDCLTITKSSGCKWFPYSYVWKILEALN